MKLIANLINPLLALLLVLAPFMANRLRDSTPDVASRLFWLRAGVGILVVYIFAHINRWLHLWPSHPLFPSGHMAFAVSAATSLVLWNRRWLYPLIPVLLAQAVLLVVLHYHVPFDVVAAWFLALPVTYLCHALLKPSVQSPLVANLNEP